MEYFVFELNSFSLVAWQMNFQKVQLIAFCCLSPKVLPRWLAQVFPLRMRTAAQLRNPATHRLLHTCPSNALQQIPKGEILGDGGAAEALPLP
eukprot:3497481-Amphidinium_carterae.1